VRLSQEASHFFSEELLSNNFFFAQDSIFFIVVEKKLKEIVKKILFHGNKGSFFVLKKDQWILKNIKKYRL